MSSNLKTFVFSELPQQEKEKFMEFMLNNNFEFVKDEREGTYIATIKIVNSVKEEKKKNTDSG
jgi:hypothetical protein